MLIWGDAWSGGKRGRKWKELRQDQTSSEDDVRSERVEESSPLGANAHRADAAVIHVGIQLSDATVCAKPVRRRWETHSLSHSHSVFQQQGWEDDPRDRLKTSFQTKTLSTVSAPPWLNTQQMDVCRPKQVCLHHQQSLITWICWDFNPSEIPITCGVSPGSTEAQQQPDSTFVACGKWRLLTDVVLIWTVNRRGEKGTESWKRFGWDPSTFGNHPSSADVTSSKYLFYCSGTFDICSDRAWL